MPNVTEVVSILDTFNRLDTIKTNRRIRRVICEELCAERCVMCPDAVLQLTVSK